MTIWFIVLLLILLILITFSGKFKFESATKPIYYYKCSEQPVSNQTRQIFEKQNISRTNSDKDWDLFLPCGYNYIEKQLDQLKLNRPDQMIFGITDCDNIVSKPMLWSILATKYGRSVAKTIMPESYVIGSSEDLDIFKQQFRKGQIYILKNWKQRKLGLKLTKNYQMITKCPKSKYQVVQKYITNPYLLDGRKINFRIYLLIVCHQGISSFYVNKNLKCIYTQQKFSLTDIKTQERHFTSLNLNPQIYEQLPFNRYELSRYWGQTQFDQLMNSINKSLYLLALAIKPWICQSQKYYHNLTFQLFGLDYLIDAQFKPWLLEINKGPDMAQTYYKEVEVNQKVLEDTYNLITSKQSSNNNDYFLIVTL